MKQTTFTAFARQCIARLEGEGRYSTAHLYKNALRSYSEYLTKPVVRFSDITRERLWGYQCKLTDDGHFPNTISTYMRMLRSIYNQGVDFDYAPYVNRLFHGVYTGIDSNHKKALPRKDLQTLFYKDPGTEILRIVQKGALMMYQLCGMSFVDIAHVRRSDIVGDTLEYRRMKTGTKVRIKLLSSVVDIINYFTDVTRFPRNKNAKYLFAILKSEHGFRSRRGYTEYQSFLRRFNMGLSLLGKTLGVKHHISSYTLRHSWATTAKNTGAPIEMISESLGHKFIKTTQIYLSGFQASTLAKMNMKVCKYTQM